MSVLASPRLTAFGHEVDTSPQALGELLDPDTPSLEAVAREQPLAHGPGGRRGRIC
jgi:hypothetical protein